MDITLGSIFLTAPKMKKKKREKDGEKDGAVKREKEKYL